MRTRREFLAASSGALVASLAAACSRTVPSGAAAPARTGVPVTTGDSASGGGGAALPTYVPFQGPTPDFPASSDGIVPAGYLSFPQNLVKSRAGPVGKQGDTVSFLSYSINPSPAAVDQNPAWQQVNRDLGLDLQFTYTALQDYNVKLNTVLSSGQLPDIFTMNVLGVLIPNEIQFFQSQCADLTPFVSGDAIKAFPNLANLPQSAWRNCLFNGKFYALPRLVNSVGSTLLVQQNALDEVGIKGINSKDDFATAVKATTTNGQYGIGGVQANTMQWVLMMYRVPNQWGQLGGKFTKDWETPQYKDAVALMRSFWDAGYVHPDTPTYVAQQGAQPFYAGKFAMYPTNFFAFGIAWDRLLGINKNFRLNALIAPGYDGGKGTQFQDWGGNQITVLKNASSDRIKQVLGVLNYLAAPFGSEEYLNLAYGQQGTDFTFDSSGNPVYTQTGQNNVQYIAWQTIISPPAVLYDALDANFVKTASPIESAAHELAVTDPSVGLYSPTNASKGAALTQAMIDGVNQILFGRSDISSLDGLVQTWRTSGGDQIRSEYESAFAQNSG
jgi:putative aldouronate transport system substrate-binding protein